MLENIFYQLLFFVLVFLVCVQPLGWYIARVYEKKSCGLNYILEPFEFCVYRICGIDPKAEMSWEKYLLALLSFNFLGFLLLYCILRFQYYLPFNPQHFVGISPALAFNTAASFITNTDWQAYSGESSLSYFTQMTGLTVQNFLSAACGIAVLMALIRGLSRHEESTLGNFWVDLVRGTLYLLLPLALLFAVFLSSQGVIQNIKPYAHIQLIEPITTESQMITEQIIPMGPTASQVAIKQLGSNGGGFFNANAAHPFENPTPLTNFFQMLAIILIPGALCAAFGILIKDKKQGLAIFIAMFTLLIPLAALAIFAEQLGNPLFHIFNIDQTAQALSAGGNMEGKEIRFGILNSALWATLTTATSNGSVNAMLDSFTPLGGMAPLGLMHLGEVVFGGVGTGLAGMLKITICTVFIVGLMVGRTPEYLGKKIEPFEMKMAVFGVLLMPIIVLLLTAIACVTQAGIAAIGNPGVHGFTEILYNLTSMGNNNGSAFAGLNANTNFYNIVGGIEMLIMRLWVAIPILAIAGSMVKKKRIPNSAGTLPTHSPLFIILLVGITFILSALTFFPTLALGPITEFLMSWGRYGH